MNSIVELRKKTVTSAYELIYRDIRRRIFHCELKPGERIVEEEISLKLNVSRTPTRQALKLLATDGYISFNVKKGATVKKLCTQDISDIWLMQSRISGLVAEVASERMSDKDIRLLYVILEKIQLAEKNKDMDIINNNLKLFDNTLRKTIDPYQLNCLISYTDSLSNDMSLFVYDLKAGAQNLFQEHYPIYLAIKQHDKNSARKLTEEHVLKNGNLYLKEYLTRCELLLP